MPVSVYVCVCVCRLSLHVRCAFLTMRFLGQKRNHVCFVAAEATHTHAHTYTHTCTYTRTGRLINEFSFSLGLAAGNTCNTPATTICGERQSKTLSKLLAATTTTTTRTFNFQFMSLTYTHCTHTFTHLLYNIASAYVSVSPLASLPFSAFLSFCFCCFLSLAPT